MLSKGQEYAISFHRKTTPNGYYHFVTTTNANNEEIANHISDSGKRITEMQIEDLQKAINGEPMDEYWGEVIGSQLEIFTQDKTVQIGYASRRIPIQDFKRLLEEWLEFIS